ncbi:ABC transporter ATP-binding protein [Streptococcus sp. DD12]|uniref:ABC transporter ATP-binding protein n=1 Tax=Streptococcus sp. DD12 TaxID=1777880 RepID=UPI00079BF082|nr:ABC transporter ATP-binding protein [Streptococcus sp. DD12]KXT76223.1 ABC transporter ATP binding protein [Streptococcus sp. DD12]
MALIQLTDVSLKRQGKSLLSHLNWTVNPGEAWAILGLNGAGKSTLLKLLMAEYWYTQGQVQVLDTVYGKGDITALRKRIGVVGSFIAERLPRHLTSEQIILTGASKSSILYQAYDDNDLALARDMLCSLDGGFLLGRTYASLSQGEKQLVLIARSLMEAPDILILDEATSGLDLFAKERLLQHIDRIKSLPQAPLILYVTHHADEITKTFSHVLLLKEGKIAAQGPKHTVLRSAILSDFYDSPVKLIPIGDDRIYIRPDLQKL